MKLAAIDIGTNSIHMVVVRVLQKRNFEVIDRVKEMAKLGAGVFATNRLSDLAYKTGLDTIERYVHLAEELGVDDIITAATSATREAQNGEAFLNEVVRRTGIMPRIISGKEEARLIFLAVRNAIALENENALVLDIGGGSTEAVVGNRDNILFGTSLKLGVLRLLDMFPDEGAISKEAQSVLESHIQFIAQSPLAQAKQAGFTRVIGTSGTIRTLGEAAYIKHHKQPLQSLNAEVVALSEIEDITHRLIDLKPSKREKIEGISSKRSDAIHLGGVLLVQLLKMAEVTELTLCEASLREGLIIDYIDRHSQSIATLPLQKETLRHRKAAQLVDKYGADWERNSHVAGLALQLFEQTRTLHKLTDTEREILEYAALLHNTGKYISFKSYHKSSRYILKKEKPRGFTDIEMLLIGHIVRYHRKGFPKKKHKQFKRLLDQQQQTVWVLAGLLRIAIGLDRARNQQVKTLSCNISDKSIEIVASGEGDLAIELWAAMGDRDMLSQALNRDITITR